ncbi:MAG: hypothetical protein AAGJ96_06475 [Pseudomonadota bacterium]
MWEPISEGSFAYIAFRFYVPILLTIVVGGVVANLVIPAIQRRFEINRREAERRVELRDEIAANLGLYLENWRRLLDIAVLEQARRREGGALSEDEAERKRGFVQARNAHKDEWVRNLVLGRIYFSAETMAALEAFHRWDRELSSQSLDDLPERSAWDAQSEQVFAALKSAT